MPVVSIGDLVTMGCLVLDCTSNRAVQEQTLIPESFVQAPERQSKGVLYHGIGYAKTPEGATKNAYSSLLGTLMFETGFEINTAHLYLVQSKGISEDNSAIHIRDKSHAMNFLSKGKIQTLVSKNIVGGYQTEIAYYLTHSTIEGMREWSESLRKIKLQRLKDPYLYSTGKAYQGRVKQSLGDLERIAKLRALRNLAEATTSLQRSYTAVLGNRIIEDEIRTSSYAHLQNFEVVSIVQSKTEVTYMLRMLKPDVSEYIFGYN